VRAGRVVDVRREKGQDERKDWRLAISISSRRNAGEGALRIAC
jgi:hypothetical protein